MKCYLVDNITESVVHLPYKSCGKKRFRKNKCINCNWFRRDDLAFSGKDLKRFRDSRGWTLIQMSSAIGSSLKTIKVIEKEDRIIGLNLRLALAALIHGLHPIESDLF